MNFFETTTPAEQGTSAAKAKAEVAEPTLADFTKDDITRVDSLLLHLVKNQPKFKTLVCYAHTKTVGQLHGGLAKLLKKRCDISRDEIERLLPLIKLRTDWEVIDKVPFASIKD